MGGSQHSLPPDPQSSLSKKMPLGDRSLALDISSWAHFTAMSLTKHHLGWRVENLERRERREKRNDVLTLRVLLADMDSRCACGQWCT